MLRWYGRDAATVDDGNGRARELFRRELFGIDAPLARVADYFKAAAAGSDVGRRLLLLLGPPSGGKSTMAVWRRRLFGWMLRNAQPASDFFHIPPNRAIEIGTQVVL